MKKKRWFPSYGISPVIICLLVTFGGYFGVKLLQEGRQHIDLSLPPDTLIPLVSFWVLPYCACYLFWVVSYLLILREGREVSWRFFSAEASAKLLCYLIFILFPTTLVRPQITGTGFFNHWVAWLYRVDTPENLFPSIHCLCSWIAFRGVLSCKGIPSWYKAFAFAFALLTFASVLLTRQHVLLDIPGGILAAELGLLVSRHTRLWQVYGSFTKKKGSTVHDYPSV